jgi:putative flippase GtrA
VNVRAEELVQVLRYLAVGVLTNALLFSGYLLMSTFGIGAKTAMSVLYVPGVMLGFFGHRNFAFRHEGRIPVSMVRYFATYAFGYVLNFASLVVFVDMLLLPADYVVLVLIVVTAGILYTLQRFWVFPRDRRDGVRNHEASVR